jgi:DNA excision repair protein ERCC-4
MSLELFPSDFETGLKPILLVDTREQTPLQFTRLASEVRGLPTGDYSIRGLDHRFVIERKTVQDFVACCVGDNRTRFEAELTRMRGYEFRRLLIVGTPADITSHQYRSNILPRAVFATLSAFEARYCLPVVFEPTPEAAAARLELWACWYHRERLKELEALTRTGNLKAVI